MLLRKRGLLGVMHAVAACLLGVVAAEESSILRGASVDSTDTRIDTVEWDASALIDGGFMTPIT